MVMIIILVVLALLFLVVELVLLPGFTVTGLLALASGVGAVYIAYDDYGNIVGTAVLVALLLLSVLVVCLSLRAKTWQRFALKEKLSSSASESLAQSVAIGARGKTISRLSPMGSVEIGGKIYEAKLVQGYLDPRCDIEVVGFQNSNIIVKKVE